MTTTTRQELFDHDEPEQQGQDSGVGRRRFLAGLGAGALALGAGAALGQEKGPNVSDSRSNAQRARKSIWLF